MDDSSDDEKAWAKEVQHQHRLIRREKQLAEEQEREKLRAGQEEASASARQPKFFQLKSGESFKGLRHNGNKRLINKYDFGTIYHFGNMSISAEIKSNSRCFRTSLGDRLKDEESNAVRVIEKSGNRQMTFSLNRVSFFSYVGGVSICSLSDIPSLLSRIRTKAKTRRL